MTTNGDFWDLWGIKIMGTRGKIVDVIHHLPSKVPRLLGTKFHGDYR